MKRACIDVRLTANRGKENHQITHEAQPTVVVVNQSGHEQPRRRDDREIQQAVEEELSNHSIARNLLTSNFSVEFVSMNTGLPQKIVEEMKQHMDKPTEEVETVQDAKTMKQEVDTVPSEPFVEQGDVNEVATIASGSDAVSVVR